MPLEKFEESSEKTRSTTERLSSFMKQAGVSEILEWTFMYDKQSVLDNTPYNTTFFQTIAGVSYQDWKEQSITSIHLISSVNTIFNNWIQELEEIKNELGSGTILSKKTIIEQEGIDFIIIGIQTAKSAIEIELEKSSKIPLLTPEKRDILSGEVEQGQEKLYGGKISENREEALMSLELLCQEFSHSSQKLDTQQQCRFLEIYDQLTKKSGELWEGGVFQAPDIRNYIHKEAPQHAFTKDTLEKIKDIKIPRETYMELWQGYIDAMGLHQQVISNPHASSIYDGPNNLEVPTSKSYQEKSILSVLSLMIHEIGAHYMNQATSEINDFQIRGAKNIEKEEGLAIILEHLFEGRRLKDIKGAGYSFPYILAGELLSMDERQDLIDLRMKMNGSIGDEGHKRDLRVMRGYPINGPGAQRKDASYGRGANKIVDLIDKGKASLADFYRGKFSIDDIVAGKLDLLIPKEKIVFPLLFPEMLLFLISTGRDNFSHKRFIDYMREKYSDVMQEEDLKSMISIRSISKIKFFIIMWRKIENIYKTHGK